MNEITFPTKWMRRLLLNAKKAEAKVVQLSSAKDGEMVVEWSFGHTKYREVRTGCAGTLEATQVEIDHLLESLGPPATQPDACTLLRKESKNASGQMRTLLEVRCHGVDPLSVLDNEVKSIDMESMVTLKRTFELEVWREVLTYCAPAMSRDETRSHLACIAFDASGRAAATDGHRLHVVKGTPSFVAKKSAKILQVAMLSASNVGILSAIAKDTLAVEIYIAQSSLGLYLTTKTGSTTIEQTDAKLLYPPIDQVIPKRDKDTVLVSFNPAELRSAAVTMSKALRQGKSIDGTVLCAGENRVTLGLVAKNMPGASITMRGSVDRHSIMVGVAPEYLAAALTGIDDETVIAEVGHALDPILIQHGNKTAVVMPQKIGDGLNSIEKIARHFGKTVEDVFTAPWTGHQEDVAIEVQAAPVVEPEPAPADGALVEVLPAGDPLRAAIDALVTQVANRIETQDGPLARQAQAHAECLLKLANGITPTPPARERKPKAPASTTPQPVGDDGLTPAQRAWKTRREKWAATGDPRAKAAA